MTNVYLLDDAIISPLGFSTTENLTAIKNGISGLKLHNNSLFDSGGFYAGIIEKSTIDKASAEIGDLSSFTKLEKMMILAVQKVLSQNEDLDLSKTELIISTTKGNIDLLQENPGFPDKRVHLTELAKVIKDFFQFSREPLVISNACVSGGLALAVAKRYIQAKKVENVLVVGGDVVSDFVVSGFQSFHAISDQPCKPFSHNRTGINLGEAAAAVLMTSKKPLKPINIEITGDASANDANHISGPSRTGEGLFKSVKNALNEAGVTAKDIDYISAHGTGTVFNDEMEAVAFTRSSLQDVPLNSYKAYYGHTLGASALVESILTKHALLNDELYPSLNYEGSGVTQPVNVITELQKKPLKHALKTASGFGGCNLALVFKKQEDE